MLGQYKSWPVDAPTCEHAAFIRRDLAVGPFCLVIVRSVFQRPGFRVSLAAHAMAFSVVTSALRQKSLADWFCPKKLGQKCGAAHH